MCSSLCGQLCWLLSLLGRGTAVVVAGRVGGRRGRGRWRCAADFVAMSRGLGCSGPLGHLCQVYLGSLCVALRAGLGCELLLFRILQPPIVGGCCAGRADLYLLFVFVCLFVHVFFVLGWLDALVCMCCLFLFVCVYMGFVLGWLHM